MPVARRYGGRQVGLAPLPGARLTAAETPTSEGADLAVAQGRRAAAIAGVGITAANVGLALATQAQDHANQVAQLEARRQLDGWELDTLDDPNHGVLYQRGPQTFGLPEQVGSDFDAKAAELSNGLHGRDNQEAFQNYVDQKRLRVLARVQSHTATEMDRYDASETQASVTQNVQLAIANATDPARVGVELANAEQTLTDAAARRGVGPAALAEQIAATRSNVHTGVIAQLLASDQPGLASAYFEEKKDQILGTKQAAVQQAVDLGRLDQQSQQVSDAILRQGGTLTEQRERARKIQDPKLRDQVTARLEHEDAVREHAQRETEEQIVATAYQLVDQAGGNLLKLPPQLRAAIPGTALPALENFAEARARGVPVETDLPTYYGLLQQASKDPVTFATRNLLELRGQLGEVEFKQLAGLQLDIRGQNQRAADAQLEGFRTKDQIVKDGLILYGIDPAVETRDPKSADAQEIATIRRMLDLRVDAWQSATGRKATNTDVQQMFNALMTTTADVPGFFTTKSKRITQLTVNDIGNDRAFIEDTLRATRRPVNDQTVLAFDQELRARFGNDLSPNAVLLRIPKADRDELGRALQVSGRTATPAAIVSLYARLLASGSVR